MNVPNRPMPAAILALGLLLAPTADAWAQKNGAVAEIRVGDPAVEGARLDPGANKLRMIASRRGLELQIGTVVEELAEAKHRGRPALRRVQTVFSPLGIFVDTTLVDRSTLAPLRHRSHSPTRVLALDYDGRTVTGSVRFPGHDDVERIRTEFEGPVFDGGPLDLVIRALPLRTGFAARIPAYVPELGGAVVVGIRVTGEEAVDAGGGRTLAAWRVQVDRDDGRSTFWIAKESRQIVRQVASPEADAEMRLVR